MRRLPLSCSLLLLALNPVAGFANPLVDGFESPPPVIPEEPHEQPSPEPVCDVPAGFTVVEKRWEDIFYGASWPHSPSFQTPIGSWSYRDRYYPYGKPAAGRLLTASFVADEAMHKLTFVNVQPVEVAGYPLAQGALSTTVTMSECRADVYAPCRVTARSSSLFYGKGASMPECRVTPGKTYWITWHNAAPDLSPTTNSCDQGNPSGGVRCDSNFKSR